MEKKVIIGKMEVTSKNPLVIIGPNGAGKSRLGVSIAGNNSNTDRISAKRNILPPERFAFTSEEEVKRKYELSKNEFKKDHYKYSSEFSSLLVKLFAEETSAAINFKNTFQSSGNKNSLVLPETTLSKIQKIWMDLFPKRELVTQGNSIKVKSSLENDREVTYLSKQLSDGELVSFYMIARVLDSTATILVIDEPEIHLHPFLAKTIWDALEDARPEIKFIYITHDYLFAESRREADYLIVRPGQEPEMLKNGSSFPPEFLHLLLGAVSADIKVDSIVFCEGKEGGYDDRIYSSWFSSSKIKVIPVGSCERVKACYEAIKSGIVQNLNPIAIIDRDFRTADEIQEFTNLGIHVLPVHELESIFGIKDVFIALAKHLGKTDEEASQSFNTFQDRAKTSLISAANKVILERSKRQAMRKVQIQINSVPCADQFADMNKAFYGAITKIGSEMTQTSLMNDEKQRLDDAIQNSWESVLDYFPGKIIFSKVEESLGLSKTALISLLETAIKSSEPSFASIKPILETTLNSHFPRKTSANV